MAITLDGMSILAIITRSIPLIVEFIRVCHARKKFHKNLDSPSSPKMPRIYRWRGPLIVNILLTSKATLELHLAFPH